MKFVFYKCAQSESEVAQQKVHELIKALSSSMTFVADNLGSEEELKKIYFKMGLYRKKGDKLLQSYFFSIKDSSVGFDKAQEVILVFDKSCRLEIEAKEAGTTFYPSFKFYNAPPRFYGLRAFVSVALIVGLFLKEIDAKTFVFDDIFFAALLHDLGLLNFGHEARSEDLKQMSEQDKEAFYQHPERGAELAKKMGVKPILCQAIAHHHQRLNGEGFPKTEKGKAAVVNRIGELIGLAEELVFLVNTAVDDDALLPTEKLRLNLTDRYSPSIKSAYQKIFPVIS